jgi:hypothetical protein
MNPPQAIEWNIDKSYLRTLASRGVSRRGHRLGNRRRSMGAADL